MASSPAGKVNVGIVGAGNISDIYLKNLSAMFDNINVVGIADLVVERAQDRAEKFGVGAFSVDELLAHPDVEIVLNLTIPAVHAEIAGKAIANGKSAYNEKPLATNREDGKALLAEASAQGVLVGSAPDTFLGGGLQSARKYLDDGLIGAPVAVSAQMLGHGMESWHPDPSFFFQPGAGPLFDVGVYYVQALASMIGPVARVASMARASFPERIVGNGPKLGEKIAVNTPTHIMSSLEFENGVIGALGASFDVWETTNSTLVIYGSEGTLRLPDPNTFGGPLQLLKGGETKWTDLPLVYGNTENSRGLGVWDMANAIQTGEAVRASGELGYHVLDIMTAVLDSAEQGRHVEVESTVDRPDLLPLA
ncbi:MAG: Gfo/Idh/MocA family oxidoreductase [Chloroflexia bacterium]|nr:Gfo/Idh/MocA family oxidoreductase [Chloroflexia bacterium]